MEQVATDTERKSSEPTQHEQIAARAYALWQAIGCP